MARYYTDENGVFRKYEEEPVEEKKTSKKKKKDTWFKSGAFGDGKGNLLTDALATIGSTVGDIAVGAAKGVTKLGEGVVDLGMYGVAEAADFIGADGVAKGVKNAAKKDFTEGFYKPAENITDKYSVLGNKADSVVEGIGQVGGVILTAGIGAGAGLGSAGVTALTTGVNFASSAGSGMSQAYQEGASDKDALKYGLISGAGEAASELLFAGLGKGVNALGYGKGLLSLDDALAKKASNLVSSRIGKNLVELGVKAGAEGTEEVISGVVSAVGKKLSYMPEKDLKELIEDEQLLDQFIVGAITSGIAQSGYVPGMKNGSFRETTSQNRDMITGLTSNEQKVVDAEIENRIADKEKNGKKLTNKEKRDIAKEVENDLKRGYVSIDTIESALGGDNYTNYKSRMDAEEKLQEEIRQLKDIPESKITVGQRERLNEARKELADIQKTNVSQLKSKLTSEVDKMTADDMYLRESYNEKGRRSAAYEADISKYDEKQQPIIQKAIDSGILNNTNRTHEFVDMLAKISSDKGVSFDFADSKKLKESGFAIEGKIVNGYVEGKDITLNINSPKALNKVVGHEITHILEGTEMYSELQAAVKAYAETKGEYQERYDALASLYEDIDGTDIDGELTADMVGDYLFTDENFINNLSAEKPGLFKKIYEEIKYLIKVATAGSKEAKQLEKVKRVFDKAYKENIVIDMEAMTRYSLVGVDENGVEIYETSKVTKQLPYTERKKKLLETMKKQYAGRTAKFTKNGNIYYAMYDKAGLSKGVYGDKKSSSKGYKAKINIGADGNYIELAENALYAGTSDEQGKTTSNGFHENAKTWDYYEKTIKSDGVYYDVLVNVKDTGDNQFVYDITLKEADLLSDQQRSYDDSSSASNSIISQTEQNTSATNKITEEMNGEKANEQGKMSLSSGKEIATDNYNVYGKDLLLQAMDDIRWHATSQETADIKQTQPVETQKDYSTDPEVYETEITDADKLIDAKIENLKVELESKLERKEDTHNYYNQEIARKQSMLDKKKNKGTKVARDLANQIEKLKKKRDDADAEVDKQINAIKERIDKMSTKEYRTAEQRKVKQASIRAEVSEMMGDTSTWKDKKTGLSYKLHTLKRNLRDVVGDTKKADEIYRGLQGRYNHNEALLKTESNKIKKEYADMHINKYEDQYIQMLGEYKYNPDTTLTSDVVSKFYEKHKNKIDAQKVDKAIDMARKTYDDLFKRVNEVLREHGLTEIAYREGYFPHFTKEPQGLLAKLLNWKKEDNSIPTDIAGLTEQFKPNKSWQAFSQHRNSDVTDYSFLTGIDAYVAGSLDWIHHINDIQRFRAFENEIRYRHSDARVQEQIKKLEEDESLDADEFQAQLDGILAEKNNPLNQLVQNIRTHTNLLAGKKNTMDRAIEEDFSRNVYSIVKNGSSRINANMVGGSISSALTNFIPITQSWSQVSPLTTLRAMRDTIKSRALDDGTIAKSDFLTNRLMTDDKLSKTTWDKVSDKISGLMEIVDNFTSQTVWRSKYLENLESGMNENEAIQNADEFAEGVMAGRSRGNMPVIFESKNPITKIFTAFQLEVANQYDYMLKDMPTDMKNEKKSSLAKAYASMFVGAYAYNALYSKLTGRDAAFDPIGIIQDILGDLFDDEEDKPSEIFFKALDAIGDETPYLGGVLFDGGRIPISSALPYGEGFIDTVKNTVTDLENGNTENLTKEWLNPLYYLALPAGGGQLKKTNEGLAMFSNDKKVSGSYTTSGNLRFAVEDNALNRIQATLFGQWASENAQKYIEEGRQPLRQKQIDEFAELGMSMQDYWAYRDGLKDKKTVAEKFDYIYDLNVTDEQKNIMINNLLNRKEEIDMSNYGDFGSYEEYEYYNKNPEKYNISKVIGEFDKYSQYEKAINAIESDKDENGDSINGSRKENVIEYLNALDADYGTKILLYKMEYPSDNTYNSDIVDYLNERQDITYQEMEEILLTLGFTVDKDGTVRWK